MKSILITGCSSGIGYATCQLLRDQHWRVLASCKDPEDTKRLQAEGFHCITLDITNDEQIKAAFNHAITEFGHLDALFCNAGFGQPGAAEDLSRDTLQEQFNTNVFGTWQCIHTAMTYFRHQKHGKILVNSSILGYAALSWRGAYNSSKYALEGLCDTLRQETMNSDIYISLLEPGPIITQFRANALHKFKNNIDIEKSVHFEAYQAQLSRLSSEKTPTPFSLSAKKCAQICVKALSADKPKARYPATFPTHLFWYLKRLLPTTWFDALLYRSTKNQGK